MKHLKAILLMACVATTATANATKYVVIKQTFMGRMRLISVDKPGNLKKWHYDSKSDIYYRAKNGLGIPVKITRSL